MATRARESRSSARPSLLAAGPVQKWRKKWVVVGPGALNVYKWQKVLEDPVAGGQLPRVHRHIRGKKWYQSPAPTRP